MKIKNKKLAAAVALLVMVLTFGLVNALPSLLENWYLRIDKYRDICVHEAYAIITYQPYRNVVVLDVRSEGEFNGTESSGHITGAINIEWTELEANLSVPAHCPLVGHENDTIIVYCKTGGRSANASEILANHGFKMVYNMVGGIDAWTHPAWNYPVTTEVPLGYTDISVHEAYEMMTNGSFPSLVIVDVRTPESYTAGHIENAINIPYYSDADFGTKLAPLAGHENDEIIVYCQSADCSKSSRAAQYLVDHGFTKVYDMLGGIDAWKVAGYPVVIPSELPFNPSVEQGVGAPSFWTKAKYADVPGDHIWSETSHTGSRSLALIISPDIAATQWHGIRWYQIHNLDDTNCPFTRGQTYTYRAWYQTSDCQMVLYAAFWGEGYTWIGAEATLVRSATPETWEQSSWITFTIPTGAKYIAIGMNIKLSDLDPGISQALGRADDFEVQEVN